MVGDLWAPADAEQGARDSLGLPSVKFTHTLLQQDRLLNTDLASNWWQLCHERELACCSVPREQKLPL